jgi:hypothetical protein
MTYQRAISLLEKANTGEEILKFLDYIYQKFTTETEI